MKKRIVTTVVLASFCGLAPFFPFNTLAAEAFLTEGGPRIFEPASLHAKTGILPAGLTLPDGRSLTVAVPFSGNANNANLSLSDGTSETWRVYRSPNGFIFHPPGTASGQACANKLDLRKRQVAHYDRRDGSCKFLGMAPILATPCPVGNISSSGGRDRLEYPKWGGGPLITLSKCQPEWR